jgi:hypothetical protein
MFSIINKLLLQVSFPPFFCEVFLYDLIDDDKSRIIVQNGFVEVTLTKRIPKKWNQLSHVQSGLYFIFYSRFDGEICV